MLALLASRPRRQEYRGRVQGPLTDGTARGAGAQVTLKNTPRGLLTRTTGPRTLSFDYASRTTPHVD